MRRKGSKVGYIWTVDLKVLVSRQFAHVSRSVNIEWGFKENRVTVIALHKCGKSDSQIFEILKPLKISRKFVYRTIKRYKELWGVEDRTRSGRPRCVRTKARIKTVPGADSPKSAPETELLVPRAKHIAPIDVTPRQRRSNMRSYRRSKGFTF